MSKENTHSHNNVKRFDQFVNEKINNDDIQIEIVKIEPDER